MTHEMVVPNAEFLSRITSSWESDFQDFVLKLEKTTHEDRTELCSKKMGIIFLDLQSMNARDIPNPKAYIAKTYERDTVSFLYTMLENQHPNANQLIGNMAESIRLNREEGKQTAA